MSEALQEVIHATGHEHVAGTHKSTWELTHDDWLTPAGDCILGVEADRTPAEFDPAFCAACRESDATVTATLSTAGYEVTVTGRGHQDLTFDDDRSLVVRTSEYIDDRTVMIGADAAATDINRDLITALTQGADCRLVLSVR
jgi:hypothetical protein